MFAQFDFKITSKVPRISKKLFITMHQLLTISINSQYLCHLPKYLINACIPPAKGGQRPLAGISSRIVFVSIKDNLSV